MPILRATRCEAWLSRSVTATTRRRPPASASSRMARAAPSPSRGRCERRRRRRHWSIEAASGAGCAVRQRDVGRRRLAASCRSSWGQRGQAADAPQERDGLGATSTGPNSMSDVRTWTGIADEDRNRKGGQESRKGTGIAEGDEMCRCGRRSQEGRCRGVRRTTARTSAVTRRAAAATSCACVATSCAATRHASTLTARDVTPSTRG